MIKVPEFVPLAIPVVFAGCIGLVDPGSPGATRHATESPTFFAIAVDHFARDARGRLLVDPRPLRPEADLRSIEVEDLAPGADSVIRVRSGILIARGITLTDAILDQRCTFSEGAALPPGREAVLSDSVRAAAAACDAREAYTTLVLGLPVPVTAGDYPAGTWRVSVHRMDKSGFQVWDLFLRIVQGEWEVFASERRMAVWS